MNWNQRENKKRIPYFYIICEGKNKTERNYFKNYQSRDNNFNFKIFDSEATDPMSMAKKANNIYKKTQLDARLGDHFYCLVDLDLSPTQLKLYLEAKQKFPKIEFILSNPCFEIWLIYHFEEYPKVQNSSENVKKYLAKYHIKNYEENFDQYELIQIYKNDIKAIEYSERKNRNYINTSLLDRNPYTEVQDIVTYIKENRKQDE